MEGRYECRGGPTGRARLKPWNCGLRWLPARLWHLLEIYNTAELGSGSFCEFNDRNLVRHGTFIGEHGNCREVRCGYYFDLNRSMMVVLSLRLLNFRHASALMKGWGLCSCFMEFLLWSAFFEGVVFNHNSIMSYHSKEIFWKRYKLLCVSLFLMQFSYQVRFYQ